MATTIDQLVQAVRDRVNGLGLTLNGQAVTVVVRKDARRQAYQSTRLIAVSKAEAPEGRKRFASGYDLTSYVVQVTVVTPGNDDHATNLGTYASWRQSIVSAFRSKASAALALTDLRDVRPDPGGFLPVDGIDSAYDVQTLGITIEVVSTR